MAFQRDPERWYGDSKAGARGARAGTASCSNFILGWMDGIVEDLKGAATISLPVITSHICRRCFLLVFSMITKYGVPTVRKGTPTHATDTRF